MIPASPLPPAAPALRLWPLQVANMTCSMAMMAFVSLIGPYSRVLGLAPWQAGTAITVGGVLWMLLARAWGRGSDRHGRRRILLAGTVGFMLSYWAMCIALNLSLALMPAPLLVFFWLVLTRSAVGAFYAALPTTGIALVADHYPPQQRAGAIAAVGAANAIGIVAGPAIASLLARESLSLPLYATLILPVIAVAVLWVGLPRREATDAPLRGAANAESVGAGSASAAKRPSGGLRLNDPRLRRPLAVAFIGMFCVAIAQITVGFFALDRLGLDPVSGARAAGLALACVGIALALSQSLVRKLGWPPERLIRVGGTLAALGFAATSLAGSPAALALGYFVAAAGMGWVFPAFSALASNRVQPQEQGSAAGSVGAAQGLGLVIGPLAGAVLYDLEPGLPYLCTGALLLLMAWWPAKPAAPVGPPAQA